MKAVIVDDESYSADYLEKVCLEVEELEVAAKFQNVFDAIDFVLQNDVELIFMDIEMPGMNGIDAVRKMHSQKQGLLFVFVTGYEQYALDAFKEDAVSYLLKPCEAYDVRRAVERAKRLLPVASKRVEIKTFGRFSMFIDGIPYRFSNAKAKELLALLIDRNGSVVTMEQAVDVLWEDRPYDAMVKQLYRKAIISLNQLMNGFDLDFFKSNRGSSYIIPSKLDCDYFRLLSGDRKVQRLYNGEYLLDYSWAEETNAKIIRFLEK